MDADQNNQGDPKLGDDVLPEESGGKSPYAEHLGKLRQTWPQFEDLWEWLYKKPDGASPGAFRILIADSKHDGIKGSMWASNSTKGHKMSKKVVSRIKTPLSENVQIRIIVLELEFRRQDLARDIVDAIGWTYDVDPAFLNAFFCHSRGDKLNPSRRHSSRSPLPQKNIFLRFHGFCVGNVMDRPHPSGTPMKLVLVLSWISGGLDSDVHGIALDGAPSIYGPLHGPLSRRLSFDSFHFENEMGNTDSHCQIYASWLSQLDQHQRSFNNSHPYEFIYPWVEYRMYDIEADICHVRLKLDQIRANFSTFGELGDPDERFNDEDLFSHANNVRVSLADAMEVRRTLAKLGDAENKRKAEDVRDSIKEIVEDADRGLRIISEMQQTAIGTMAIQESRRSIKEAAAVKRLTQLSWTLGFLAKYTMGFGKVLYLLGFQLASVFIPLSYATGLFGMNISEMTGTGLKLWVFLVTSLALLIGATTLLWLSSQHHGRWAAHMAAYLENRKQVLFGAVDCKFEVVRVKFYKTWHDERIRKRGKSKSSV